MRQVLTLVLLVGSLSSAWAQAPAPKPVAPAAKAHLEQGLRYFNTKDYDKAILEFKTAYQIDPQADFLYAMGQAERLGGKCREAIRTYESFLRENPPERQAGSARQNIERCEAELARQAEAEKIKPAPTPEAESQPVIIKETTPEGGPWYTDKVGHALTLGGLAVFVAGTVLWRIGYNGIEAANNATSYEEYASNAANAGTADAEQKVGVATMAAGGVLIAAGIVHYILRPKGSSSSDRAQVTAAVGPGGGMVGVTKRF